MPPRMMGSPVGTPMQQQVGGMRQMPPPPPMMGGGLPPLPRGQFGHMMPPQFPVSVFAILTTTCNLGISYSWKFLMKGMFKNFKCPGDFQNRFSKYQFTTVWSVILICYL